MTSTHITAAKISENKADNMLLSYSGHGIFRYNIKSGEVERQFEPRPDLSPPREAYDDAEGHDEDTSADGARPGSGQPSRKRPREEERLYGVDPFASIDPSASVEPFPHASSPPPVPDLVSLFGLPAVGETYHDDDDDEDDDADEDAFDEDDEDDDLSSSPSIPDENIDFDLVYALHNFVATVEGQATVHKGNSLTLLDDSNSYW